MSPPFVEDVFFYSFYIFSFFVKNQVSKVCGLNQVFGSIILINLSVFMPIQSFCHYCSSITELMSQIVMAPEVPILYKIVLTLLVFLYFFSYPALLLPQHLMILVRFSAFNTLYHCVQSSLP